MNKDNEQMLEEYIARKKEQEEIERLKKIIEEQNAINITREDLEKENAELLEQIKQIKAQNKAKPLDYDYNEAQTRKYFIDVFCYCKCWQMYHYRCF